MFETIIAYVFGGAVCLIVIAAIVMACWEALKDIFGR
jgi:hypothetical protein